MYIGSHIKHTFSNAFRHLVFISLLFIIFIHNNIIIIYITYIYNIYIYIYITTEIEDLSPTKS